MRKFCQGYLFLRAKGPGSEAKRRERAISNWQDFSKRVYLKGLNMPPQSKPHWLRWSLFLLGIYLKVYCEDFLPNLFSLYGLGYIFHFRFWPFPSYWTLDPPLLLPTDTLFPPFHRITRMAAQSTSSCILVLAFSRLFSFSDALILSTGLQADCYYQLAGFG